MVDDGQGRIDQRDTVAGSEYETVCKGEERIADIPAHRAGCQERRHLMRFGTRSARVSTLTVIQHNVNILVDKQSKRV